MAFFSKQLKYLENNSNGEISATFIW